ncbi:hypothetical protein B0H14DRAFT_2215879, partial [Mycena olivaceomarginata]
LLVSTSAPMWGKLYKYFSARLVYLASVGLFLVGSIVGGSVLTITYVAEPKKRPMLIGLWMGIFMLSTIVGLVIGGIFTSKVTWRWCFWINAPAGGLILLLPLLFFHVPKHVMPHPATWKEILPQLDLLGFGLLLSSLICFTLALQCGGQTKAWNEGSVIRIRSSDAGTSIVGVYTEDLDGISST